MKATLMIDDDVAEILEKRSRDENKPFEQVANEALRRGTSADTADAQQPALKPHDGKWMAGDDPARLKEILADMEVDDYDDKKMAEPPFDRQSFERAVSRRKELFGGRPLHGDSVELIREAREIRDAQSENWA